VSSDFEQHKAANSIPCQNDTILQAQDIHVELDGHIVLAGAEISLRSGEIVGLVGPNGAGKSTLLRVLTHVITPQQGTIRIAGKSLDKISRQELARRVAVVQQLPEAPGTLRVRDLVLLGRHPYLRLLGRESVHDFAIVEDSMKRTGCLAIADRELGTLSGGERRRAFIARALAQKTPLLLLDEPTVNLDVRAQHEILELMLELATSGMSIFWVAHDLTLAATYCDRIVLLDRGRIVATGKPSEVLTPEIVGRVYGHTVSVISHPGLSKPIVIPARLEQ
jgi:iron complex transport system ATP-binding protein